MQETVSRIPRQYVREDFNCAQVMIPYEQTLSIFDKDGLVFNQARKYDFFNKYLDIKKRAWSSLILLADKHCTAAARKIDTLFCRKTNFI